MPRSRRQALRFTCKKRKVSIRTAYEEGQAVLINISTKGCAMVESSLQHEIGEIVLISFNVQEGRGENKLIEVQAEILRIQPQLAVQFTRIEQETESLILKYFIAENRESKSKEGVL